ncbi:MAG: hypothetical protein ACXWC9_03975 [Pseudobdellovibrionaceae bacterium]
MMKRVLLGVLLAVAVTACVHRYKQDLSATVPERGVSSEETKVEILELSQETARLVYISYDKSGKAKREEFTQEYWNGTVGLFDERSREDYLRKMYFANTRKKSLKGIRHAACFEGSAQNIVEAFFNPNNKLGIQVGKIHAISRGQVETKASSDGRMLGISFEHESDALGAVSFRLQHCDSGKGSISEDAGPVLGPQAYIEYRKPPSRGIASAEERDTVSLGKGFEAKPFDKNYGFKTLDTTIDPKVKRRFVLRANYEGARFVPEERPWVGLNLRNETEALKFALMAQAHFYENMANQSPKPDDNFIAQDNQSRYWCHMPWMNTGPTGREAIHGLTQERDMMPSTSIPSFLKATAGSNWGIAYFNAPGCRTINKVFGSIAFPRHATESDPNGGPDFTQGQFENGTMIAKILFTTANFPAIKGAFTWNANVSEPGSTIRRVKPVRHIQMDIAIRDAGLGNVKADLGNWVMAGFYYDPTYDYDKELKPLLEMENPLKQIPGLPKAFFKMRPMGIQTGFDKPETGDTIRFPGAVTNGFEGRLNGPADNPRSSCMSCHGTAGTKTSMVPGFLNDSMFKPFAGKTKFDFNLQMSIARSHYETEMK